MRQRAHDNLIVRVSERPYQLAAALRTQSCTAILLVLMKHLILLEKMIESNNYLCSESSSSGESKGASSESSNERLNRILATIFLYDAIMPNNGVDLNENPFRDQYAI